MRSGTASSAGADGAPRPRPGSPAGGTDERSRGASPSTTPPLRERARDGAAPAPGAATSVLRRPKRRRRRSSRRTRGILAPGVRRAAPPGPVVAVGHVAPRPYRRGRRAGPPGTVRDRRCVIELLVVVGVLGVVLLVGLVGLLAPRLRKPEELDGEPPRPGVDYAPGVNDDSEVPRDTATRTVEVVGLPEPGVAGRPADELDVPEGRASRLVRLRGRLSRSQGRLGRGLFALLSRDRLDEDTWEEVEETLLAADLGLGPTTELVERLRERTRVLGTGDEAGLRQLLREELTALLDPDADRTLTTTVAEARPAVVLVVGVNGTGKTTTVGKLARLLVADGRSVVLGAADTFRAAAAEQLTTWGSRVGAETVRGREGADPASVAFDAVRTGAEAGVDVVLLDTAGRLHTKAGLMDELGKVKRVVEKQSPVDETLLVLDATTGQNGLAQARVFTEVVQVTGVVLTKLDGTAKGGVVVTVQRELGVPVKLVGLGEGVDDLAPFEAEAFADALLGDEAAL